MKVSILRPELELVVSTISTPSGGSAILELSDPTTGFRMIGNAASAPVTLGDGTVVQPHCTHVVTPQDELVPIRSALAFESRFARLSGKATPLEGKRDVPILGSSNDWHDDSRSSHSTSGARRHFVSVGFERALRGFADGLESIRSWAKDQRNRPVAWWPFEFKYNGFHGTLAQGWDYDEQMLNGVKDPKGWGIFDPAHVETSILFAGAALGDLECLGHLVMGLAPWICSTFPGGGPKALRVQKGWRGSDQERAVGRMIKAYGDLALLGIGIGPACAEYRDTFLAGLDPKQHLLGLLRDLELRWPPLGSGKPDERTMVDFKDGSREIAAFYPWHCGIMFHDVARVVAHSGLVGGALRDRILAWFDAHATLVVDRSVGDGGVAWAASRSSHFTQSSSLPLTDPINQSCDKANALETDKTHVYELVDGEGDGFGPLRDRPRVQDAELLCAGVAMLRGADDPTVEFLLSKLPKPGAMKYTGNLGRYLDPVYAMQEQLAVAGATA